MQANQLVNLFNETHVWTSRNYTSTRTTESKSKLSNELIKLAKTNQPTKTLPNGYMPPKKRNSK